MKEASLTLPLLASGFRPWVLFLEVKSRFSMGRKVLVLEVRKRLEGCSALQQSDRGRASAAARVSYNEPMARSQAILLYRIWMHSLTSSGRARRYGGKGRKGRSCTRCSKSRQASSLRKEIWEYLTYYITRSLSIFIVAFVGAVQPGVSNGDRIHGQRRNSNVVLFL